MYEATIPSFVARVTFFAAVAMPLVRKIVSAFSRSPPLSTRARLQSINPALVFSRSFLTSFGSISVVVFIKSLESLKRQRVKLLKWLESGRYACHFHLFADASLAAGRNNGIDQFLQNHPNSTDRIIVPGNRIIDEFGIGVGIHDGDHRDPEAARLVDGVLLPKRVDDHERIRQFGHVDDPLEVAPQFCSLTI